MDIESILEKHKWMWTTHKVEFYLVRLANKSNVIVRLYETDAGVRIATTVGLSSDVAYMALKHRLLNEGVRVVSSEQMRQIQLKYLDRVV